MTRPDAPFHRDKPQRTIYVDKVDFDTLRPLLNAVNMSQREFVKSVLNGLAILVEAAKAYSPDGLPRGLFVMWAFDKLLTPEALEAKLEEIQTEVAQELKAGEGYYKKLKFKRDAPNPRSVMVPNRRNRDLVRILRQTDTGHAETGSDGEGEDRADLDPDRPEVG